MRMTEIFKFSQFNFAKEAKFALIYSLKVSQIYKPYGLF